jgi:multidrug efflux pump subunit AcrA (membrane-fusion protein)
MTVLSRLSSLSTLPALSTKATSVAILPLILAIAVLLSACSKETPAPPVPRLVKVFTVGDRVHTNAPIAAGVSDTALIKDPAALSFDAPGLVMEVLVSVGDVVAAGQAIARLDPQDLALSESSARTQLLAAQAELSSAESDFKRFAALRDQGFISQAEFDRRKAQLTMARAAFEAKADQLGYLTLRAIAPGRVQRLLAKAGDRVAARQLITQLQIDPKAKQEILQRSPRAEQQAKDQRANSRRGQPGRLEVPISALLGADAVFRLLPQADGTARIERVAIITGRMNEQSAEVMSGLSAGDLIVAAGVHVLSEGDLVRLPAK